MPLNQRQIAILENAISSYAFPAVYFDFVTATEVQAADMRQVERAIHGMLTSPSIDAVKGGLANVIYWGYAQIGYRHVRVHRFLDQVSNDQLVRFRAVASNSQVGLASIAALNMPELSGISFISKVLAFLDPVRYCVLDKQLLKLASGPGSRALHRLSSGTQIRVTPENERAYDAWRNECSGVSAQYFSSRYRVVDIERGFFQLVQADQLEDARQVYEAA